MPLVAEGITQLHSIAFENLLPAKRLGDPDRSDRAFDRRGLVDFENMWER